MWTKLVFRKDQLETPEDQWNASIEAIVENETPGDTEITSTAWHAYAYYSEMESGGHEAFLYHFDYRFKEFGANTFLKNTVEALGKIGAMEHAANLKQHGLELWTVYTQLEQDMQFEEVFYERIAAADEAYHSFDPPLHDHLENFFEKNYHQLIEIRE
ncbi:hypothetical protein JOD03_001723 [Chryseomicrobium aureum]|uniref:DMP19 family protein n=1 Tax=Chryseomicrobium aureum TaxID=1441723 RepID=UPI0019565A8E|nr:hypothetical protein [Chryseomicrobium aureum]MBM7706818.1 hypothetical protein [Chryseomicrobium aureum]